MAQHWTKKVREILLVQLILQLQSVHALRHKPHHSCTWLFRNFISILFVWNYKVYWYCSMFPCPPLDQNFWIFLIFGWGKFKFHRKHFYAWSSWWSLSRRIWTDRPRIQSVMRISCARNRCARNSSYKLTVSSSCCWYLDVLTQILFNFVSIHIPIPPQKPYQPRMSKTKSTSFK